MLAGFKSGIGYFLWKLCPFTEYNGEEKEVRATPPAPRRIRMVAPVATPAAPAVRTSFWAKVKTWTHWGKVWKIGGSLILVVILGIVFGPKVVDGLAPAGKAKVVPPTRATEAKPTSPVPVPTTDVNAQVTLSDKDWEKLAGLIKEQTEVVKVETPKVVFGTTKSYEGDDCEGLDGEGNCIYRIQKLPPEPFEPGQDSWYLVPSWAKSAIVERDSGNLPFIAFKRIHTNGCTYLIIAGENVKAGKMVSVIPTFTSERLELKIKENLYIVRVD